MTIELKSHVTTLVEQNPDGYDLAFLEDEWVLERFLKTKKGHLQEATEAILRTAKWRRDQNPPLTTYQSADFPEHISSGVIKQYGTDLKGRPVWYFSTKLYRDDLKLETFERFLIWTLENHYRMCQSQQLQTTLVIDVKIGHLGELAFRVAPKILTLLQNHYPELLGSCLIVGAPKCFTALWKSLEKFINPGVRSKILFCQRKELEQYMTHLSPISFSV